MPRMLAPEDFEAYSNHDDILIVSEYNDTENTPEPVYNEEIVHKCRIKPAEESEVSKPKIIETHEPVEYVPEPKVEVVNHTRNDIRQPERISIRFADSIGRMATRVCRTKPAYADCWLVGSPDTLESPIKYETPCGNVVIGRAADGETEYNLTPFEYGYGDALNSVVGTTIDKVRDIYRKSGGRMDRHSIISLAKGALMDSSDMLEAVLGSDVSTVDNMISEMSEVVYRYTVGLGIFELLLADPKLEDVYIDAPCDKNRIHVTMNGVSGLNSHLKCRTNLMVNKREVQNLINVLKRESGLPFCESSPILETDMKEHEARATVVGYPMSPNGDAVAIRKHSIVPWTLTRLIANGTVDSETAGMLSFLVDNRSTFLVCGARGAGKSSLLSALMFEFPMSQRILTIEDTIELPGEKMRRMGYKVQSMLIDDRGNGDSFKRADEALRVSLRMGESAIVLGEVRGEEAKTLYQSMRTGRAGSSIMGTIHGDSAKTVYERVVHDMNISPEAFMATDILVTLGTTKDRTTGNQIRKVNEFVATGEHNGTFLDIAGTGELYNAPVIKRILASSGLSVNEISEEIKTRGELREFLSEMGSKHGDEFFGPEWISMANDHMNREFTSGDFNSASVVDSFRKKFARCNGFNPEEL